MLIHYIPGALQNPDLADLIQTCKGYVDKYGNNAPDDNLNHSYFRDTMKAIFGKDALEVISHLSAKLPTPPPPVPPIESNDDD